MKHIKYYSNYDMSIGYGITEISSYFSAFDYDEENYNLTQILEMYNILKFFDNNLLDKNTFNDGLFYKCLGKRVGIFFNRLNEEDILTIIDSLEFNYENDFFECLVKFKTYERITSTTISNLVNQSRYLFRLLLENKELVFHYNTTIREIMLSNPESATFILEKYEVLHDGLERSLFLPECLTLKDKEEILCNYINTAEPNLNYVRLVVNVLNNEDLYVSNKTRLLAKRKSGSLETELFKENHSMKFGASVTFCKQRDVVVEKLEDMIITCSYSIDWIEENLDYPTLLNNFIYVFGYVDKQMRCVLYSNKKLMGIFSRLMGLHSRSEYQYDIPFIQANQLANIQLIAYKNELSRYQIQLEDVFEWFFSSYLKEEFNMNDFYVSMPSKETTFFEKCKLMVSEIESILKQFNMYAKEKTIDHELLEISSDKFLIEDCASLVIKKYAYCSNNNTIDTLNYLLFSDQCMLKYMQDKKGKQEENFCDLLLKHNDISEKDIVKFEIMHLNWLKEQGVVEINQDGYLQFKDIMAIIILRDLYYNNTISYWHYSKKERDCIDKLANRNFLFFKSSLFTKEESDYISFHLNRSRFNNGYDLRNKYSHGTHPSLTKTEIHEQNYHTLLKLLTVIIIKINDDLSLNEKILQNKSLKQSLSQY